MRTKLLIVPGLGNSGELHWQSLWETMFPLTKRVVQKSWEHPICADWVEGIESTLNETHSSRTYIVAHSLGTLALAHWALKTNHHISGALLVAPPDINLIKSRNLAEGFSPLPEIRLPFKSIVVASNNDPYASSETAEKYAQMWGSWYINIGNKGHINADSNIGFWPEGLKILHLLTNQKQYLSFA